MQPLGSPCPPRCALGDDGRHPGRHAQLVDPAHLAAGDLQRARASNPLAPQNISYLLWMLMGFLLVTAVLVVTFGRLGDQYGRAKLFNLGFLIFTVGSIGCALVPNSGGAGALEIIIMRIVQGVGGAMLYRELDRDHHRRVPARSARLRARRQPGLRAGRLVHGPDHRRRALRVGLARGVLGERAGRRVGHLDGLPHAARQAARQVASRSSSTGGATSPSASA